MPTWSGSSSLLFWVRNWTTVAMSSLSKFTLSMTIDWSLWVMSARSEETVAVAVAVGGTTISGEIASLQSWLTRRRDSASYSSWRKPAARFFQPLDMVHFVPARFVIGIEDQSLGVGLLRPVELSRPGVIVALEKKLLHGGDAVLEFVRHRRVVGRSLGIVHLGLVGLLLLLEGLQIRDVDGILGLKVDRFLKTGRRLGKLGVLGQLMGLARLGLGQAGFRAIIKTHGDAAVVQGIEGILKTIGRLVIFLRGEKAFAVVDGLLALAESSRLLADSICADCVPVIGADATVAETAGASSA